MQGQTPLKIGDEKELQLAINNEQIFKCPVEQIEQVLRYIMMKVGIRAENLPSKEEKAVLIAHVVSQYGKHTIQEIRLAFDMAITLKLDLEERDIICYENFSCLYFSKIMSAYRIWASQVHKEIVSKPKAMIENNQPLTDEEKAQWLMDWKVKPEINIELIPLIFYDFLTEKKLIELTNKQKWEYTEKATVQIKVQLHEAMSICKTNDGYLAFNKFCNEETNGFEKEFAGRIKNRAKRLIVFDYLNDKFITYND